MTQPTATNADHPPTAEKPSGSGQLALAALFLIGTINFVDRQLLSVMVEPIRAEIALSDTQFGLLTGLAFALFYAAMGVPVAMLADRGNRVRLIAAACMVWSVFTALSGSVSSFWQLALVRFGVGAGEAGGTAPSLSVIADLYPPRSRPLAIGIFTCNGPFGVFVGSAFGGWAAAHIGWRNAFYTIGLLGILIAPLLILMVKEPVRGRMDGALAAAKAPPLRESVAMFMRMPSLRLALLGSALAASASYGILNWIPAFLMRTQGMPLNALATWYAAAAGITFGIGTLGGGWIVSKRAARSPEAYGTIPALASAILVPSLAVALLADGWQASLALLLLPLTACIVYIAPALALVQNLTPQRSRATAAAILMLMLNIVGMGLGPLFVGLISDELKPRFGDESLRWALMAILPLAACAGITQWRMARHLKRDLAHG